MLLELKRLQIVSILYIIFLFNNIKKLIHFMQGEKKHLNTRKYMYVTFYSSVCWARTRQFYQRGSNSDNVFLIEEGM